MVKKIMRSKRQARKAAKLNQQKEWQTTLIEAARAGDISSIKECELNGANINEGIDGNYGDPFTTPLAEAIKYGRDEAAIYLMNSGTGYKLPTVSLAIQRGNYSLAKILLRHIAPSLSKAPETDLKQYIFDPLNNSVVDDALAINHIISLERNFIRNKIILWVQEEENTFSKTDLELLQKEPYPLHELFIKVWEIPNTPLLVAILNDKTEIALHLMKLDTEKISLDKADYEYNAQNTPLLLACKRGNTRIALQLIELGANVNCQDFRGFTPLHWASILRLNEVIELLLKSGADPTIKNAFGKLPLDYYVEEIKANDLSFYPTSVEIKVEDNNPTVYPKEPTSFKPEDSDFHKENTAHRFSTKTPDYSDLYWHIGGIFYNLHLPPPAKSPTHNIGGNNFNLFTEIFAEIRSSYPVNEHLIELMSVSSSKSTALLANSLFAKDKEKNPETAPLVSALNKNS